MRRGHNDKLKSLIAELGWSQQQTASRFVRVAQEMGHTDLVSVGRSTISMWVCGTRPQDPAPAVLCETLSRGLARPVRLEEIGLGRSPILSAGAIWGADTLTALADLGRSVDRRGFIGAAVYSVAGLALPEESWWQECLEKARARPATRGTITSDDIEAIRDATALFQRLDQQRGGGYGTSAATALLADEVLPTLRRHTPHEEQRRELFSAASELVYVLGWSSFDANRHATAQRYLQLAAKLAAEAGDRALVGHILRALAHQAMDLGHYPQAASLTEAATSCYDVAGPRERALLGVVHARSLARVGDTKSASQALLRAEDDLSDATPDTEPARVWFFGKASLAHETARTLQAMGDLGSAQREFERSVQLRGAAFSRTHAVTLGYLGEIQASRGEIEAACATWSRALDAMEGVRSGRAKNTVRTMRTALSTVRGRGISAVREVDLRAAEVLRVA
jgi:tetratricopeptide (TPR) repeat protein